MLASAPCLRASACARSSSLLASASLNRLATIARRIALLGLRAGTARVPGDFESEAGHARHLARRRHQAHAADAEIAQDLRADAIDAQVGGATRRRAHVAETRLQRIGALAAVEQHHHAFSGAANGGER